jgi:hypothetical protein
VHVTFLPSNLHLFPLKLRKLLSKEVRFAQRNGEMVICLYGNCFPDMDIFCEQRGIKKVKGHQCYEMLLGSEAYKKITEETSGTFFCERDLIMHFEDYCIKPLELDDEELKKYFFKDYSKLIYLRQPCDPDLSIKAKDLAAFLGISLEIRDADYTHLERELRELIKYAVRAKSEEEK